MSHSSDHHLHTQLSAYNSAFAELGLRFRWDADTLRQLASIDGDAARLSTYIETHHRHLLTAYSCDFLCAAILERKNAMAPGTLAVDRGAASANGRTPAGMASEWSEAGLPALAGA